MLTLRSEGIVETLVDVALTDAPAGTRLLSGPRLAVRPGSAVSVKLELPPLQKTGRAGKLEILTDDGSRDPLSDPWLPIPPTRRRVQLMVRVDKPADVRLAQDTLFFREGVSERPIVLRNAGEQSLDVLEVEVPEGYEVSPLDGTVPANDELSLLVRRVPSQRPQDQDTAIIRFAGGRTEEITLFSRAANAARVLPKAIVGIDFGTAFTSVVLREYRLDKHLEDPVTFLGPPSEDDPQRFRTRIWAGEDGSVKCAGEATARYNESPSDGFLFREIKTLLRDPTRTDLIYPQARLNDAVTLMKDRHGDNWPQWLVTRYLSWLRQTLILPELQKCYPGVQPNIVYVFSLPVLDFKAQGNHPLYDLQREQMEQCITEAGFPLKSTQFQFEPVCAALGLLHPQNIAGWPELGTQKMPLNDGDTIALFDSGGGTTDVVLMRAEREGTKVLLNVEKCLGVGSRAETFGGEVVTSDLIKVAKDPNSITVDQGPWLIGSISEDSLFENSGMGEVLKRDEAETVKSLLAQTPANKILEHHEAKLRPSLLFYLTRSYLKSLYDVLPDQIFPSVAPEKTTYYLGVGGNAMIPFINQWISLVMHDDQPAMSGRRLQWPASFPKLAVAYGTVWVYDSQIRNAVPYELSLYVGNTPLLTLSANTSEETMPGSQTLMVPGHESVNLRVMARLGNNEYLVDSGLLYNGGNEAAYNLVIGVQNGRVRVSYQSEADPNVCSLIDYRL